MKLQVLITVNILLSLYGSGQVITRISTDSLLVTNDSCDAEFNLESRTRNIKGFLYNKGNGRTEFRKMAVKINDSTYVFGSDTVYLGFPKRFGVEDSRAGENRNFNGNNSYYVILDSTVFGIKGKDGSGVDLPSSLQGAGTRMFFFPKKDAFRAGTVQGSQWDTASIGLYSSAMGLNPTASGYASFAAGSATASNNYSIAFGTSTSSAVYSTAAGDGSFATGTYCLALGKSAGSYNNYTIGIGNNAAASTMGSIAIGSYASSLGFYAFSLGDHAKAGTDYVVAWGQNAYGIGANSFVLGSSDSALANFAMAMGYRNKVRIQYQTVFGKYNDTTDGKNLFAIAFGNNHNSRKNVFTVDTSGKTVVGGTSSPASWLEVKGSFAATVTTVTSNTTLDNRHYTILADASGGNITLTLPAANSCTGRMYTIKLISSSNSVIVQRSGTNTIDGATSVTKSTQWQMLQVQSNGTHWYITGG